MQTRILGGEGGQRGFFGGTHAKTRIVGLVIVAIVGAVLTIALQLPGLVASVAAAGVVYVATIRTHRGSPLVRLQRNRRWKERVRTGTVDFTPVTLRPAGLDQPVPRAQRKERDRAWVTYRDWPDGAEGMHWLQRDPHRPGIAWHTPTGEDAYLSVAFTVEGQIRGIESDRYLDAAMTAVGDLFARYGSPSLLPNRVQLLTRVVPVDSAYHEAWAAQELDPRAPRALVASYDEVVRTTARVGLMQRHYAVVRWPLTAEFLAAAARRGRAQAGWQALMATEIAMVRSHLTTARFGKVTALTASQLAAVLRHMQVPSWPIDDTFGVDVGAPWVPSHDELSTTSYTGPGPDGQVESWWQRTALIPIEGVETGERTSLWVAPLLWHMRHPIVRTLSLQTEIVPAAVARRTARADVTTDLADLDAQRRKGVLTDEERTAGLRAARARLEDLAPGSRHHGAGWSGHLTIAARSRDGLVDATAKITEAAGNAGIAHLEWLDTQQAGAAACTWPLARGMAPAEKSTHSLLRGLLTGVGSKEAI